MAKKVHPIQKLKSSSSKGRTSEKKPSPLDTMEFRSIPGYEERFEISCTGVLRRKSFQGIDGRRYKSKIILPLLIQREGRTNHLMINAAKKGDDKSRSVSVGKLVLLAWGEEEYIPGMYACHKDGNPLNNHISNLEWRTGPIRSGEDHPRAKLTDSIVKRARVAVGSMTLTQARELKRQLAEELEVTKTTIHNALSGQTYKIVDKEAKPTNIFSTIAK